MLSKSLPSLFSTLHIVSLITVPNTVFSIPLWSCLGKFLTDLAENATNSFTPVCLRQHSKQVGIIHSPCVLFPFRGQEDFGWVSLMCVVQNTGGGNFFQPALNWKVSLWVFLCAIPSASGVACHAAFSPASESFASSLPSQAVMAIHPSYSSEWLCLPAQLWEVTFPSV